MFSTHSFYLFSRHIYALITMIFGSFVAGSSPEEVQPLPTPYIPYC